MCMRIVKYEPPYLSFYRQLGVENIKLNVEGADLAMVKLTEDININTYPPICVPESGKILLQS